MKVFGLTGGIGMGKSAAALILGRMGVPVIDTDQIAREIVEPGQPALGEIVNWLGPEILDPSGCLNRPKLARTVFGDDRARNKLEQMLHPRIRQIWQTEIQRWRNQARYDDAAVVIPLLYETQAEASFDAVICLACTTATQRERLLARGWDLDQIEKRIQAQWPIGKKVELADYVIWTEGGFDVLEDQLARIFPRGRLRQ